jgi:tetratricopeptide (TPR) repeat protein
MKFVSIILVLLISACTSTERTKPVIEKPPTLSELLTTAHKQLKASTPELALKTLLDAKQQCDDKYNESENKIFLHRSSDERFFYLLQASFEEIPTSVQAGPCGEISYLLGYTYIELGDINNAEIYVLQAAEYSPVNAAYLAELGYISQTKGDFQQALSFFERAEENAESFSPKHSKQQEFARAKRGVGFNLIELGKLEEAKIKFNEALQINPSDQIAISELTYIAQLQAQN